MTANIPTQSPAAAAPKDDLGIDRAFLIEMAKMPLLAVAWVAAALAAQQLWAAVHPTGLNAGPLVVVLVGMVVAAFIDGWALKVPNWITLPLILSGWSLGLLHDCGLATGTGTGGFLTAVVCTGLGFALLFPMLAIGGVGVGDVKMQMGFGAWVGAYFGSGEMTAAAGMGSLHGLGVVFWAFAFGAIAGGVFGLAMILIRRQWGANAHMLREIGTDLKLFATGKTGEAGQRAQDRRKIWVKLPYGIPLCVGFLLFLWYRLILIV